jgi:hypothetical protein
MTFVEDQMDFIERLLDREGLDPAVAESCAAQLAAIRRRHSDPILRLGVIGEFSSGKSAFINALLGDELLKTDLVVTTTVPTEVVAGERLELELRRQGSDDWLPTASGTPPRFCKPASLSSTRRASTAATRGTPPRRSGFWRTGQTGAWSSCGVARRCR